MEQEAASVAAATASIRAEAAPMEQEAAVDSTILVLGSIALGGLVLVLIAAIVLRRLCARGAKVGPYEKPPKQQQVQPKKKKSGGKSGGASPKQEKAKKKKKYDKVSEEDQEAFDRFERASREEAEIVARFAAA